MISLNLEELCQQHYGQVHPSRHPQDEFHSRTCIILAAESYSLTYTPKLTEKIKIALNLARYKHNSHTAKAVIITILLLVA